MSLVTEFVNKKLTKLRSFYEESFNDNSHYYITRNMES